MCCRDDFPLACRTETCITETGKEVCLLSFRRGRSRNRGPSVSLIVALLVAAVTFATAPDLTPLVRIEQNTLRACAFKVELSRPLRIEGNVRR